METIKAIAKRKSTRAFSPDKQVSEADLNTILCAGCAAPAGMADYASLHLTVIQNPDVLAKIDETARAAFNVDRNILYNAPVLVLVSASEQQKAPNIQYSNAACVIENMLLAATDAGIDSVYIWGALGVITKNAELCNDMGIPAGFMPISGVALGYAAESNTTEKELSVSLSINYV